MSLPWVERPSISLNAKLPYRERFKHLSPEVIQDSRTLLDAVKREIPDAARPYAQALRLRTMNRFQGELTAMAERVGDDWQTIFLANLSYDLLLMSLGCSTVALPTPNGPVLARNMDWWPEDVLARSSYVMRTETESELKWINAGWPGAVGAVTGLSGRGFALALNAVQAPEPANKFGYPMLLHLRCVLEDAGSFDEAVKRITKQKLMVGGLVTLVGTKNSERVVIERGPSQAAQRWGEPGRALVTTNDYRLLHAPTTSDHAEIYQTTDSRYGTLCKFFAEETEDRAYTDEELLYALTDERVIQGITAQHIIMRPCERSVRLYVPRKFLEILDDPN